MIHEYFYPDQADLIKALTQKCQISLKQALEVSSQATLMVSGGSTPLGLYQALSRCRLDWQRIRVGLVDERWVDHHHPGSNAALIRQNLLKNHAAAAAFTAMKNHRATALLGRAQCEAAYQMLPQPFTLTILGMGNDGHTASLFPFADGLKAALDKTRPDLCIAINAQKTAVTGDLTERMSLTLGGLMQSKAIILLLRGEEKKKVYLQAKSAADAETDAGVLPVSVVLAQHALINISVYWSP